MTKIIFFDLDGTLRQTKSGKTFINEPDDQQPIEGTQKALAYYQSKGFICIGITNQGGVAAGHKSLQSAIEEQRITLQLFPELSEIYFCPNYDGKSCWQISRNNVPLEFGSPDISCRKPSHGMLLLATSAWVRAKNTDFNECYMIGDRQEDKECAERGGAKFIWASILHAKFASPGMREIECQHVDSDVLAEFLSL